MDRVELVLASDVRLRIVVELESDVEVGIVVVCVVVGGITMSIWILGGCEQIISPSSRS